METQRILVDSDIIIDHLRKQSDTLRRLSVKYSIAISTVTLFELYYGIFKGGEPEGKVKKHFQRIPKLELVNL